MKTGVQRNRGRRRHLGTGSRESREELRTLAAAHPESRSRARWLETQPARHRRQQVTGDRAHPVRNRMATAAI